MYQYRAFGLGIESEAPIELASSCEFDRPDATVRFGDLSELRARYGLEREDRRFLMDAATAVLHWRSVGTVTVAGGREIIVHANDGAEEGLVGLALAGPPLGILLHQRGRLVLHASGVVIDGGVVAFVGHKGYGKSTTAAALHTAGFDLFTDDILSVDVDSARALADPGFGQLKLWPGAADAVFDEPASVGGSSGPKQLRQVESAHSDEILPMSVLFVLDTGDLSTHRVSGREAVIEVLRNLYASRFVGTDGTPPDNLIRCSSFVNEVEVYRLRRKPGLAALPAIVDLIVDTVRESGGGP